MLKDLHEHVIARFIYVKTPFYSVDETILLEILKLYGISVSALNWFDSYLGAHLQYVWFNNSASSISRVNFGVPQGGSISPILLILFIHDREYCSNNAVCVLYADWEDVFNKANTVPADYSRWFQANKLTLNVSKTTYVLFRIKKVSFT